MKYRTLTTVLIGGEPRKPGEIVDESELPGGPDRLVAIKAIRAVRSDDEPAETEKESDGDLEKLKSENEKLKDKNVKANEIIDALTDEELEAVNKRLAEKKASEPLVREELEAMTKAQLLALCEAKGLDANERTKKDEIIDLLLK